MLPLSENSKAITLEAPEFSGNTTNIDWYGWTDSDVLVRYLTYSNIDGPIQSSPCSMAIPDRRSIQGASSPHRTMTRKPGNSSRRFSPPIQKRRPLSVRLRLDPV
ncbi:hypothetical protein [Paenibacillus chungangensis]|uniref:Uncharacterized protein n=1 Tax=Paenibacillus chungangensis TaxID=696535 RepID=A0ABW3HR66_9BACL